MALTIKALNPGFVAKVTGVSLGEPFGEEVLAEIVSAIDNYAVCIFPDQPLTDERQLSFSARLGPLETTRRVNRADFKHRLDTRVTDVSNLDENNCLVARDSDRRMIAMSNRLWHTDSSFKKTPAKYSLLSARAIPSEGGETQFADLRAAYNALTEKKKQEIDDLIVMHWLTHLRSKTGFDHFTEAERAVEPPMPQVLVCTLPGLGRKTLYLAAHADHVIGMPVPEGRMLLMDLMEHATQPEFVHTHTWRVNDLVIWDDRCTMHRVREFGITEVRDMHRTTVSDVGPTIDQARVA